MVNKESKVFDLVPVDPKKVRASDLYEKAKAKGIGQVTAGKHLKALCKDGKVRRLQEGPKEVYYQQVKRSLEDKLMEFDNMVAPDERREKLLMELLHTKGENIVIEIKDGRLRIIPASLKLMKAIDDEFADWVKVIKEKYELIRKGY